jgi:tyrosyl-tRNA synthetase
VRSEDVHGLVAPLITTASGAKFGKSEAGAIYLDPELTSPYKFYQFWMNTDDRDVDGYLRLFTTKPKQEITSLLAQHSDNPGARIAQRALAEDQTRRVHAYDTTVNVMAAASILFGDIDLAQTTPHQFDILAKEIPTMPLRDSADNIPTERLENETVISLVEALMGLGLTKSKSEARRTIQQGGVEVNRTRVTDVDRMLGRGDWLLHRNILVCRGKKHFGLVRLWR